MNAREANFTFRNKTVSRVKFSSVDKHAPEGVIGKKMLKALQLVEARKMQTKHVARKTFSP
jgi:hypothetical protein